MGPRNEIGTFSGGGARFCAVSGGSARVWSTDEGGGGAKAPKHEIVPDAHLASPLRPGAVAWLRLHSDTQNAQNTQQASQKLPKSRKRKSSLNAKETQAESFESSHIAFGTTSGKILIYSLALAKIESILEDSKADRKDRNISCIDWSSHCGLYSCSSDSTIKEWSIENNTIVSKFNMNSLLKTPQSTNTTIIRLVPDKWSNVSKRKFLLTAACQLHLWCLDTKTVLKTMIGHANSVCHLDILCFPSDNRLYAISGSKSDRILSFWSINVSNDDLNKINGKDNDDSDIEVNKPKKRISKGSVSKSDLETITNPSCNFLMEDIPQQISCKALSSGKSTVKLSAVTRSGVVHYYEFTLNGVVPKPVKPNVTLQIASDDKDGSVKPIPITCSMLHDNSLLLGYTLGFGMTFEFVEPNTNEKVQVIVRECKDGVGSKKENEKQLSETITKIKRADENASVVYLSSALGRTDHSTGTKRSAEGKTIDVPMESRLANLSLASSSKPATNNRNMTQLLVQGLHSKDSKLLQAVFECNDKEVAENTLNNLPIQYVSPLMDHIIEMLAGKTNKCRSACLWAEALCKAKSSALLSLSFAENGKISGLRNALAARVPSLSALLGLRARLVLTLHRMSDSTNTPISQNPLIDYIDASSGDEMGDDMDEALINNVEDDSASWNEEDDSDDNENDHDNSSNESDENMSVSDNGSVVSE